MHRLTHNLDASRSRELSQLEGIIPALETSHAIAWLLARGETGEDGFDIVCLSGRGDKDLAEVLGLKDS